MFCAGADAVRTNHPSQLQAYLQVRGSAATVEAMPAVNGEVPTTPTACDAKPAASVANGQKPTTPTADGQMPTANGAKPTAPTAHTLSSGPSNGVIDRSSKKRQ